MFKICEGLLDLTFEDFKGEKNGYELHSRKIYWTLIGRWMDLDMRCPVLEWTTSGEPTLMGKKLALAQLRHGTNLSPQCKLYRPGQFARSSCTWGSCIDGGSRPCKIALHHQSERDAHAAGAIQPQAPRRGRRYRLPVLPHQRGNIGVCGNSADEDLHELPLGSFQ